MGTNLHIYQSSFVHESRILKITRSLAEHHLFEEICVIARWEQGLETDEPLGPSRRVLRIPCLTHRFPGRPGKVIALLEWYLRILCGFWRTDIDCINCHSLVVLPLCVVLKHIHRCKLIYDTHELETETSSSGVLRKWVSKRLERTLLPHADAVIVVGDLIRDWYVSEYGRQDVEVVRNAPRIVEQSHGEPIRFREELGISPNDLIFLYQGLLDEGRGIEILLDAFSEISPQKHVVFMGYGPLVDKVKGAASCHSNIHFREAVPPEELHLYTAAADVGLSLIENVSLSYYYCLPNKLFEYLHAIVPAIVSDFPEMGEFVDRNGCGWKTNVEPNAIRKLIDSLSSDEIASKRQRCLQVRQEYQWQGEEERMLSVYRRLFAHDRTQKTTTSQRRLAG